MGERATIQRLQEEKRVLETRLEQSSLVVAEAPEAREVENLRQQVSGLEAEVLKATKRAGRAEAKAARLELMLAKVPDSHPATPPTKLPCLSF